MLFLGTKNSAVERAKHKPKVWGPLSAVRSAVWWNSDRLGVPAPRHLYPKWSGVGDIARDVGLATTRNGTFNVGYTPTWIPEGVAFNATNSEYIDLPSSTVIDSPDGSAPSELSIVCRGIVNSSGPDGDRFVAKQSDWSTSNIYWMLGLNDATNEGRLRYRMRVNGSGNTWRGSFGGVSFGDIQTFGSSWESGSTVELYIDGNKDTLSTNPGAQTGTVDLGNGVSTYIGSGNNDGGSPPYGALDGEIHILALFAHYLTSTQQATLHEQPYALVRPYSPPVWFDLGGGTSTFKPGWGARSTIIIGKGALP